jgi:hypothetical protein
MKTKNKSWRQSRFLPQHAKSVHLVLSLQSGCVSPQFHCAFDNNFETLKEYNPPESLWQLKAHFIDKNSTMPRKEEEPTSNTTPPLTDDSSPNLPLYPNADTVPEFEPALHLEETETEQQTNATEVEVNQVHKEVGLRRSNRARPPAHLQDYITNEHDISQAVQASMANVTLSLSP